MKKLSALLILLALLAWPMAAQAADTPLELYGGDSYAGYPAEYYFLDDIHPNFIGFDSTRYYYAYYGYYDNYYSATPSLPAPYITTAALNLRAGPYTTYERLGTAPLHAMVTVIGYGSGEWFSVIWNGLIGYMHRDWLQPLTPPSFDPPQIGTVELLQWNEANRLIPVRVPFTVVDVRTGVSWQMARLGGVRHADVEPLTAADTAAMHHVFNYRWTWQPRPVLVLIGDRTLAASINGMPHGVQTIHGNGVTGHFCIHFRGSRTHGTNRVQQNHQDAITEAYRTAQMW